MVKVAAIKPLTLNKASKQAKRQILPSQIKSLMFLDK